MLKDRLRYEDGSSPLTRGKHLRDKGQTRTYVAHPRSRGENHVLLRRPRFGNGSSPLTRGKQHR